MELSLQAIRAMQDQAKEVLARLEGGYESLRKLHPHHELLTYMQLKDTPSCAQPPVDFAYTPRMQRYGIAQEGDRTVVNANNLSHYELLFVECTGQPPGLREYVEDLESAVLSLSPASHSERPTIFI